MSDKKKRPRSEWGGIRLRGDIWHIFYTQDGRQVQESSKSKLRADAVALLARRYTEIQDGKNPKANRLSFERLEELVIEDYRAKRRKSQDTIGYRFLHLREHFKGFRALAIPGRIPRYIDARRKDGAKDATIQLEIAAIKVGFALAWKQGLLPSKPHIASIEFSNARQGFATWEQMEKLIAAMSEAPKSERDGRPLTKGNKSYLIRPVLFAYYTGWRKGEVLKLKWSNVDFKAGMIRLEPGTTKNGKGRIFPFAAHPDVARLMKEQRAATSEWELEHPGQKIEWVFWRGWDGKALPIRNLYHAWRAACKAAGFTGEKKLIFHDMRRSALRNNMRAGVPWTVSKELSGHKTDEAHERYCIVAEQDLSDGVAKVSAMLAREREQNS